MKHTRTFGILISFCLALSCLAQTAFAAATTNPRPLDKKEVLEAVAPLIEAEKEFYHIDNISVTGETTTVKEDGTIDTTCNIVMDMCLKARSVEELPYGAGMLKELDKQTAEECYLAAASADAQIADPDARLAAQAAPHLRDVAGNIGNQIRLTFTVIINTNPDRTVNQVLGCGDADANGVVRTFPLEGYFPDSAEDMFAQGADTVAELRETVSAADTEPTAMNPMYYRVVARNYAMKYSSEAPASKVCTHGRPNIDISYYNPDYNYHCHVDCANFVSQAIRAGAMPTDSKWDPGSPAWINVVDMKEYFYDTKGYWYLSNYEKCNAGNIIINKSARGGRYHVNMCVLNDTVNRAYAAHNADHSCKSYDRYYWDNYTEFYKFYETSPV